MSCRDVWLCSVRNIGVSDGGGGVNDKNSVMRCLDDGDGSGMSDVKPIA